MYMLDMGMPSGDRIEESVAPPERRVGVTRTKCSTHATYQGRQ